jgi:hypothetical protein
MATLPIAIGANLEVRMGREVARLSPSQGFKLAEQLLERSIEQMVVEAAVRNEAPVRVTRTNRRKCH